jgi:hypothetical protein
MAADLGCCRKGTRERGSEPEREEEGELGFPAAAEYFL